MDSLLYCILFYALPAHLPPVRQTFGDKACHPERSEGPDSTDAEILRCAQDDRQEISRVRSREVLSLNVCQFAACHGKGGGGDGLGCRTLDPGGSTLLYSLHPLTFHVA